MRNLFLLILSACTTEIPQNDPPPLQQCVERIEHRQYRVVGNKVVGDTGSTYWTCNRYETKQRSHHETE